MTCIAGLGGDELRSYQLIEHCHSGNFGRLNGRRDRDGGKDVMKEFPIFVLQFDRYHRRHASDDRARQHHHRSRVIGKCRSCDLWRLHA